MKTQISVKSLILLILVLPICTSMVFAQKKQTKAKQDILQEVKWEKWEMKFSIPRDLKETTEKPEDEPIPNDENFGESRTFARSKASRLVLSIDVTNWKGEKVKTEYESGEVELSPEQLLALDHIGDTTAMKRADSTMLEADYLEIDGITGIFAIMNKSSRLGKTIKPTNEIIMVWGTYRIFKGNVQRITVSLEGQRKQLETMKKIINSLNFK